MAQYLCQLCNKLVTYGENHPCFFYKNDDNVYSLPRLKKSKKKNKKHDNEKDIFTESSGKNSRKLIPAVRKNENEKSELMNLPLFENIEKVLFELSSKRKQKCENFSEISNNAQPRNPCDISYLDSILDNQGKEVQSKEIASFTISSENTESSCRSENDFCGAYKRTSAVTGSVYERKKCGSNVSSRFHAAANEECEISLEESKWQSFNNDKDIFMQSLECATKNASSNKNISGTSNFHVNTDLLPLNKEAENEVIEASGDLKDEKISPEAPSHIQSMSQDTTANVDEHMYSKEDDNAVAGPSGKRALKKNYACDLCPKQFKWKSWFDDHYRTHSGEKPYVCNKCGKEFAQNGQLIRHYRTHTGAQPFVCLVCKRGFSQKGNLKKHIRIHTGEKPYKCPDCGMAFTNSRDCNRHQRRKHQ